MNKLYSRESKFDDIFIGKFTLPIMFFLIGLFLMFPWEDLGRIPWYASLIKYQEPIFPNLQKLSVELPPQRAVYFRPMVAFMNVVEWPLLIYVLMKVPVADKVVSGEKRIGNAVCMMLLLLVICVISPWILIAGGTQGGILSRITRTTNYGLTMKLIFTRWGVALAWYLFLSILFGVIKKRRSKQGSIDT